MGTIRIELFPEKAPLTVKNFLAYVAEGFYNDTLFHRVLGKENTPDKEDVFIQGGGFSAGHKEKKTREPIKSEAGNGLSNARGTVGMAARADNADSAAAQFFINLKDNKAFDRADGTAGYTVFGKVIEGLDVVDRIKAVKTGTKRFIVRSGDERTFLNAPDRDVVIRSVLVEKPR
jgi:cyclophilin family peptidyl-prolyl cis-trans isomerase